MERISARPCLQIVLEAAGFFRLIFDVVALLVDDGLHPLPLQHVVGGAGSGGSQEVSLFAEAIFVIAALLFRTRFSI